MGRKPNTSQPLALDRQVVELLEDRLGLRSRHGFGEASIDRDRTEALIRWNRGALRLTASFNGLSRVRSIGMAISPPDRNHAFGLHQAAAVLDPPLHTRYPRPPTELDEAGLARWVQAHAEFFDTHAAALLDRPEEVFAQVRTAAPLGEQCQQFVGLCREVLRLEADHGFAAPEAIHWRHECEIAFRRGPVQVVVMVEDHEHAGVIEEPFTVPELHLRWEQPPRAISLTETIGQLDPAHAARRPVASGYAMALDAVRPWLEHDATFLRARLEQLVGSVPTVSPQ